MKTLFASDMKTLKLLVILGILVTMAACDSKKDNTEKAITPDEERLPGDKSIYGLACDGCTDSVFVLLPLDCSDPIEFNIINASKQRKVLGHAHIGDWVAVVPSEEDSTEAEMVINLDELKGTWCYKVMPRLRTPDEMSEQERAAIINEMPDSVKKTYFIPREYGFTLKRQWIAKSVGYIRNNPTIEDDSPVEYPQLSYFTKWHMWNGKLVIVSGEPTLNTETKNFEVINERNDTCDILYLVGDSLILGSEGVTRGYYRHQNLADVNKEANEAAKKIQQQALDDLKK